MLVVTELQALVLSGVPLKDENAAASVERSASASMDARVIFMIRYNYRILSFTFNFFYDIQGGGNRSSADVFQCFNDEGPNDVVKFDDVPSLQYTG